MQLQLPAGRFQLYAERLPLNYRGTYLGSVWQTRYCSFAALICPVVCSA